MLVEDSDLKIGGEWEPYRICIFKDLKLENMFLQKNLYRQTCRILYHY